MNYYSLKLKYHLLHDIMNLKGAFTVSNKNIDMVDCLLNITFHFPIEKTSGIYKILFEDGSYYIGKSKNIVKRIWEHLCETFTIKHNHEFYNKLKSELNNEIIVLKLSEDIDKEYEMLNLHLNTYSEYCYNKVGNIKQIRKL
jgi:predicted GIY-YIG superfamily endonuclease